MSAQVIEFPDKVGWETGVGICVKCLAGCVQVAPADGKFSECVECHQITMRFATVREAMLLKERSNLQHVIAGQQLEVLVTVPSQFGATLSGSLVEGIVKALMEDRLRSVNALLHEGVEQH